MLEKLRTLFHQYRDVLTYLFFGVVTTAVNYAVYLPLYNIFDISATVCNVIAWIVSVAVAFATNKPFVFHSHNWSAKVVLPEFAKFVGCRIGSGLLETGIIFVSVDCLHWNGNLMKLIISVLVVILNYIGSKLIVFRDKK